MKSLSRLLVLPIVLLFVHVFTPVAYAADATSLAAQINRISGLAASVVDNTVTVSGNVHSARTMLTLSIDEGVTVRWGALYMGSAQPLMTIAGDGAFEVVAGGWISNTGSGNVINVAGSIKIVVTGTSASASGVVQATSGSAIQCNGMNTVTVEGYGAVLSDAVSNIKPVINMANEADDTENVIIKDNASVWATADGSTNSGYCIQTYGNVRVDGGDIHSASGRGRGINLSGVNSTVTINGGRVWVDGGTSSVAISTANTLGAEEVDNTQIIVNGGRVEATGEGMAIRTVGTHSKVEVNGGVVAATTGYVISNETNGDNSITVSGGLVIGYGKGVTGASPNIDNIFYTNGGTRVTVSDDGLAAAWDPAHNIYVEGEGNDLLTVPAGATITWHNDQAMGGGVSYTNGTNTGFFPLPVDVTSDFGLIFDAASGKMFRNLNGDLVFDENEKEAGNEYTEGKGTTWDGVPGILDLKGFRWTTRQQASLIIVGGNTAIQLSGFNYFFSYVETAGIPHYGIYSDGTAAFTITVKGDGALYALAGQSTPEGGVHLGTLAGMFLDKDLGSLVLESGSLFCGAVVDVAANPGVTFNGIVCNNFEMKGGTLEVFAPDNEAVDPEGDVTLPAAYTYWNVVDAYLTEPGKIYVGGEGAPYNEEADISGAYIRIEAGAVAVVSDGTVSGIIELPIADTPAQTVVVTLYGDTVNNALADADATSWFTGLPAGVAVKANAAAGGNSITFTFSGTPAVARTVVFNITIPASVLARGQRIHVQSNSNARIVIVDRTVLSLTLHDQTVTYTGNEVPVTPALLAGTKEGVVPAATSYIYEGTNGTTYPATSTVPTDAGMYIVTATVASDNNYFGATAAATLTVNKATPVIKLRFIVKNYSGSPVPIILPEHLEGSITVDDLLPSLSVLYKSTDGKGYSSDQAPTEVGHYKVTVSTAGNDNHHPATATATIIIGEAIPDISLTDTSKVYDGTSLIAESVTTPDDYDGTVRYSYAGTLLDGTDYPATTPATDRATGAPVNAGDYMVTVSMSDAGNYDDIAVTSNLAITKAPASITMENKIAPYTGDQVPIGVPTCNVTGATLTITYKSTDGTSYAETETPPSGNGVYEVKAVYAGNNNYLSTQAVAILIIAQSKTPTLTLADRTVGYNGQPHSIGTATIQETEAQSFEITYTYSSSGYPASTTPPVNAGVYTVKATTPDNTFDPQHPESYYAAGEATAVLTIEKAAQTITFDLPEGKQVGEEPFNVNASVDTDLALTYQSGNPDIATIDENGLITLLQPGTVTITVSQAGTDNYLSASETRTLTIAAAPCLPFDQVVLMRWNNTLTVINNPENNGGYRFTSYQWYRNGEAFWTEQSYSAGANGEALSEDDVYYVEMKGNNFTGTLRTCESHVTLKDNINIIAYPNPVSAGQILYVHAPVDEKLLEDAVIEVYDIMGNYVDRKEVQGEYTPVQHINYSTGIYFFVLKGKDGWRKEMKVLVVN